MNTLIDIWQANEGLILTALFFLAIGTVAQVFTKTDPTI